MLASVPLSALAMTGIVALRYAAASGFFASLTERRLPGRSATLAPPIRREIGWPLAAAAIYGAPAGVLVDRAVLGAEALRAGPGFDQHAVDREVIGREPL